MFENRCLKYALKYLSFITDALYLTTTELNYNLESEVQKTMSLIETQALLQV